MFSQTTEYALRAAVHLASLAPAPQTTQQIAEATQVSPTYLAKVLQALGRAGIVISQRGLHGGVALARDPRAIMVLEVVSAVEPIERIEQCPLGLAAHAEQLCLLHRKLDDAIAGIRDAFGSTTLAELIDVPGRTAEP